MTIAHAGIAFLALALAGCANLGTVSRSTALPKEGIAVHLDAAQRITLANDQGWACSEPAPDALQAYASSLGLGLALPTQKSASIASALSANAASIGLRTQSITLMRDALYRICELYYNGAISRSAAVQLLQRSQDLTLGVLAIEQLTGAVTAQQVMLTGNGAANAASTINDTTKELDRAKADQAAKKELLDAADKALAAQVKVVEERKVAADAAKGKAAGTTQRITALQPQLDAAKAKHKEAEATLESARTDVEVLTILVAGNEKQIKALEEKQKPLTAATLKAQKEHDDAKTADPNDPNLPKLKKAWDDADAAEKRIAAGIDQAKADLKTLQGKLATARADVDKADKAVSAEAASLLPLQTRMDVLKSDPNQKASDKAAEDLAAASEKHEKLKTAAAEAKNAHETAEKATEAIAKLGQTSITSAGANTTSAGQFSTVQERYGVSKETAEVLTQGAVAIVEAVMNKGHMTDTCGVLLMGNDVPHATLLELCTYVVKETLQIWKADAKAKIAACEKTGNCDQGAIEPFGVAVPAATVRKPARRRPDIRQFTTSPFFQ